MSESPFFIAGDVLPADTPSYVMRPADQVLSASVLEGAYCYVLTARQMGKSSLMVRAADRLSIAGITVAQVELRSIVADSAPEWYQELLARLQQQLGLKTDARVWWRTHAGLGAPTRFIDFLHDVVLNEIEGAIALFIDEIDATLSLDFRDDFFAAVRATYNARASDPAYKRLTFVLLGVATPTDLIKDLKRTPFNIGRRIELREFSYQGAEPLRQGLEQRYPGKANQILQRIFFWTNGHPYLTQKLCLAAYEKRAPAWDNAQVDALVAANFFGAAARADENLIFVRDKVLGAPADERPQMLALYNAVYNGQPVSDDDSSPVQNHLELYGLVRVEHGRLAMRNEIYRNVFDQRWINKQIAARPTPYPAPAAATRLPAWLLALIGVLVVALVGGAGFVLANRPSSAASSTQTAAVAQASATAQQVAIALTAAASQPSPTIAVLEPTTAIPEPTKAVPVPTTPIPELTTAVPVPPTAVPTDTPEPQPPTAVPTDTPEPQPPTAVPTDTPEPQPPTAVSAGPRCSVVASGGVTVRESANSEANPVGSLKAGASFIPSAKSSASNDFVWVKVPAPAGWVYAGDTGTQLVNCTSLENVPLA